MKDYRNELLSTIYSLINGAIVINGESIQTVSARPTEGEYIRYFIDNDEDIGTDDNEIREIQIAFDCISIQSLHISDDTRVDKMIDQLKWILLNEDVYSLSTWKVILVADNGTETNMDDSSDLTVFQRTFNLKIIISK